MNRGTFLLAILVMTACGTPPVDSRVVPPDAITNFDVLYTENCSGCHGVDGKGGAAIGIGNPVYLAIADDAVITHVTADGVAGTSMPAFAQHSGGLLTDDQIHAIVSGIRTRWARPDALQGAVPPPYAATTPGDPKHGEAVYAADCSSCHARKAGSILDRSYLALVSDQNLRTTLIVGRPEAGAPDWRGNAAGKSISAEDVSDVVAWLASQRPQLTEGETQ
jgi:cytochrome c oxidase cbb3-type subunit III